MIIRLYNPTGQEIESGLTFAKTVKEMYYTDMNEAVTEEMNDLTKVTIPAYKIITVKAVF